MLDIGFSELLLIAVVALVVIGPKDLPVVARHVAKFMRELRGFYDGAKKQMHVLLEEAGVDDLKRDMTTIIDMEGKPQKAFDVRELDSLKEAPSGEAGLQPRPAGEAMRLNEHSEFSRSGEGDLRSGASPHPHPHPTLSLSEGEGAPAAPLKPTSKADA